MIKLLKHAVKNNDFKAKVHYSAGTPKSRNDGRFAVTIYAKEMINDLNKIFTFEYMNKTDSMTDHFEKGKVVLFDCHPLYNKALKIATLTN